MVITIYLEYIIVSKLIDNQLFSSLILDRESYKASFEFKLD